MAAATCDTCGNTFDEAFELRTANGNMFTFDSFECAIQKAAPTCSHCGCRVIGHGVRVDDTTYCCAHCARDADASDHARDSVSS